jgi:lipoprotein-releasing system permease protein
MPFELQVALRYLLAKRKQAFISVISLISILGVLIGVMALVIALALMTGMQHALRDRLLGSTAHVYVWKIGRMTDYHEEMAKLRTLPHVVSVSPAVLDYGLIASGDHRKFLSIKGVDPSLEQQVTDIGHSMISGRLSDITAEVPGQPPGIVLGKDLAESLNVGVGDQAILMTAEGTLTPTGMQPRVRRVKVVGIFSLGLTRRSGC